MTSTFRFADFFAVCLADEQNFLVIVPCMNANWRIIFLRVAILLPKSATDSINFREAFRFRLIHIMADSEKGKGAGPNQADQGIRYHFANIEPLKS